jgi:signal transduction histidine kinase
MIKPPIPIDDSKRIEALKEYSILETLPEQEYNEITFLASQICSTPISLISLIDEKRQWFKSHHGLDATETPREVAFCAHAINEKDQVLVVNDSRLDHRFSDNPLVTGDPMVIFYAGAPLISPEGYALGTLCVIDHEPRFLSESQINSLRALSNQVGRLLDLRIKSRRLETAVQELGIQNKALEKFAGVAAHDIKSPLASILMISELFEEQYAGQLDEEGANLFRMIGTSTLKLTQLIDGILSYSRHAVLLAADKVDLCINKIILDLLTLVDPSGEVEFHIYPEWDIFFYTNKIALEQIFLNLITNAIKYNNKRVTVISINIVEGKDEIKINIADNGPGIQEKDRERIFEIFESPGSLDKYGEKGNGIGLANVRALVSGLGGSIDVVSKEGEGANFEFTLKN